MKGSRDGYVLFYLTIQVHFLSIIIFFSCLLHCVAPQLFVQAIRAFKKVRNQIKILSRRYKPMNIFMLSRKAGSYLQNIKIQMLKVAFPFSSLEIKG